MRHLLVLDPALRARLEAGSRQPLVWWAADRRPPYGVVQPGDLVYLRAPGRPLSGLATVGRVLFLRNLSPAFLRRLWPVLAPLTGAGPAPGPAELGAHYASVIWFATLDAIRPPLEPAEALALGLPPLPGGRGAWRLWEDGTAAP
ncbi:conserved protein of unknown function [Candidatus Hydrogenisulfobacillus filiaventi]|uniref:ASCH domain-containing protein n=1 Tax=Candidatus Hydrogenisulfobacillus filiaventi TaxID=2707344 RepID=A0A6F8ZK09_9FIRM|nr:hypothetical protein [Bacillota bacterium]CAB1130100.1 conserved protein of unknown function [Candidatus Hydrogenisulfobacillus filiaventi]